MYILALLIESCVTRYPGLWFVLNHIGFSFSAFVICINALPGGMSKMTISSPGVMQNRRKGIYHFFCSAIIAKETGYQLHLHRKVYPIAKDIQSP